METYKFISGIILLFVVSSCFPSKAQNSNQVNPIDHWDEYISSYSVNLPDYTILNELSRESNSMIFSNDVEKLKILEENGNVTLKSNKLSFKTTFKFDEFYILNVYEVSLKDDKLLVVEWRNKYSVGRAINDVNYSVIDLTKKSLHFYSCFNGRILCFTDLDGDNKIDFIKIDETDYYSMIPFEEDYTEVYQFRFTGLDNSIKENIRQDIYVVDCPDLGYFNLSEKEITKIEKSPCKGGGKK